MLGRRGNLRCRGCRRCRRCHRLRIGLRFRHAAADFRQIGLIDFKVLRAIFAFATITIATTTVTATTFFAFRTFRTFECCLGALGTCRDVGCSAVGIGGVGRRSLGGFERGLLCSLAFGQRFVGLATFGPFTLAFALALAAFLVAFATTFLTAFGALALNHGRSGLAFTRCARLAFATRFARFTGLARLTCFTRFALFT